MHIKLDLKLHEGFMAAKELLLIPEHLKTMFLLCIAAIVIYLASK